MDIVLSDMNTVVIEGIVMGEPNVSTLNSGKKVVNFVIENSRAGAKRTVSFTYNIVSWSDRYVGKLKDGQFVRCTGHLQHGEVMTVEGKLFRYAKICADNIEIAEEE